MDNASASTAAPARCTCWTDPAGRERTFGERVRVGILYSEDSTFFSPVVRSILQRRPSDVVAVFPTGSRGAGPRIRGVWPRLVRLATLWLIWEPAGFFAELAARSAATASDLVGRLAPAAEGWSAQATARKLGVRVVPCPDPNSEAFIQVLRTLALDLLLNQTDRMLERPLLETPRLGVLNRHGSLLPRFRGRMASFWSHAAEPPAHGMTFHIVDEGLDTGPIVLQQPMAVDGRAPYPEVLARHREAAPPLFWQAVEMLGTPGFALRPNAHAGTPTYRFPTFAEARAYRTVLERRRSQPCP
jgi:folate-dependent phosphoribosylglycinamide formyltransferase PurN